MISESKVGLDRRREFLVYTVIFVIAGGSLFDIITDREHWPFSPYPMFSWAKRDYSTTKLLLFGVTESKPPREIPLNDPKYIKPLDGVRLSPTLLKMEKSVYRTTLGKPITLMRFWYLCSE